MFYELAIQGTTYVGNTNFPGPTTVYTANANFGTARNAILAVEPTIPASNSNTDANVLDVGLYVGNVEDGNIVAGEIHWASNNAVHLLYQILTDVSGIQGSSIDETEQAFDPNARTLTVDIDPNKAPITNFDAFLKGSSILTIPAQIVDGEVSLQFSSSFHTITGSATFIGNGFIEPGSSAWQASFVGRAFDGLEYIASYPDLIAALGVNADLGVQHFLSAGFDEGRTTLFDGLEYIASNRDLISAFGANRDLGAQHYITFGIHEGRATATFDPVQYLANYGDLQAAFGQDIDATLAHYITHGFAEGRTDAPAASPASHTDFML